MGANNSSKTRVRPFLHDLVGRDATGASWVAQLLALPQRFHGVRPAPPAAGLLHPNECGWDDPPRSERLLSPPVELLRWLVDHPPAARPADLGTLCPRKRAKRKLLLDGDTSTRAEAHELLKVGPTRTMCTCERARSYCQEDWHLLEGPTHVDGYLLTDHLVTLIEGKRTERGPTTKTTWMPIRHQMLRNLDDAWDRDEGRRVVGFFLVEGVKPDPVAMPPDWRAAARATVSAAALKGSLPHRSEPERQAIAEAFLGAATWDAACLACGREPFNAIPCRYLVEGSVE